MSCWRVLELTEQPDGEAIPQLLVKPVFTSNSYTVHLTCLSNIWSEELDLDGIVDRASSERSPIEISRQDTAQLAILLDNVKRSLEHSDDAICRISRSENDGITLHTTITLPKPLDSLTWKFHLEKRASISLKNELILPLLISSHIQHQRIAALVSAAHDKDKAITRLMDQYESSNLDLAAAFPILSGLKTGRKAIKREQAAKHIPALKPFRESVFKHETEQLVDSHVSTLGLFQEALSECVPKVPSELKSHDASLTWWNGIPDQLGHAKAPTRKQAAPVSEPAQTTADSSGEETDDEFEIHANFKSRNLPSKVPKSPEPKTLTEAKPFSSDDDATEDEEDLDAPPKSRSQKLSQKVRPSPPRTRSPTPEEALPLKPERGPLERPKAKGFRIGGKARQVAVETSPPLNEAMDTTPVTEDLPAQEPPSSQVKADAETTPKKTKRNFKIGGKGKSGAGSNSQVPDGSQSVVDRTRATQSPSLQPPSSPPMSKPTREESPVVEQREETAEEKAERRRADLKRKTEEAAKKHAASKKKKRF